MTKIICPVERSHFNIGNRGLTLKSINSFSKLNPYYYDYQFLEFVYANIEYPQIARENGISGTVVIRFYVDKDGMVKNISVLKDVGAGCGAEAMRVVELMNAQGASWVAGMQRGKTVKVWFNLPIKFVLA